MNARQDSELSIKTIERADQSLGSLAVQLPGATAIFRKLKLDFCCGGQISLRQAAQDKKLDLDDIVAQLAALERPDALPENVAPAALIDHILTRYHDVHREQLPELIRMARRVQAVHRDHPQVPAGLAELLEAMQEELLGHMQKEESILFPLLKSGCHPFVGQPIRMMREEHTSHGQALDQVHALTQDMQPPPGACNTWRALYSGLNQFTDDLISHIHLENNVLFPAFEAAKAPGCGSETGTGCACA